MMEIPMFLMLLSLCLSTPFVLHATDAPNIDPKYDTSNKESVCYKIREEIYRQKDFSKHIVGDLNLAECRDLYGGYNLLYEAILIDNKEAVVALVEKHGLNMNHTNSYGQTALYVAIENYRTEIVKRLLAMGADPLFDKTILEKAKSNVKNLEQRLEQSKEILAMLLIPEKLDQKKTEEGWSFKAIYSYFFR
jgi:hypothetical protein